MIPILYETSQLTYTGYGSIGRLDEAISCIITEELNGIYELEMEYPADGRYVKELLAQNRTILALKTVVRNGKEERTTEPFDIYKRTFENGLWKINAHHITYRLLASVVPSVPLVGTASAAISGITASSVPFAEGVSYAGDTYGKTGQFSSNAVKTMREYFIDDVYSVRKVYGIDFWFTRNVVYYGKRGENRGMEIRAGKNIAAFSYISDETESYNAAVAYWQGSENGQSITVVSDLVKTLPSSVPTVARPLNFSEYFESAPTKQELASVASNYIQGGGFPAWETHESAEITFVQSQFEKKELFDLGDTVTVYSSDADLAGREMRIVKAQYDAILEEYISISFGELQRAYAVTSRSGQSETKRNLA